MNLIFRNFTKKLTAARLFNFLGLLAAFSVALLVFIYVKHEYSYDRFHANRERIFQLENQRTDGVWESNFSRPNVELIMASSPHVEAKAIERKAITRIAWSSNRDGSAEGVDSNIEWINPAFVDVFDFTMVEGGTGALRQPGQVLIPRSLARKLFGGESAVGKQIFSELNDLGEDFDLYGVTVSTSPVVGGVYEDFPSNSRLVNAVYASVRPEDHMSDWDTGFYYSYVLLDSPTAADEVVAAYKKKHADVMDRLNILDIRLRPLEELYFGGNVRYDSNPTGNKTVTDILLLISLLVIGIAAVNFVNFSIAQTSVRIKNINTRKVMGCPASHLRREIVVESVLFTAAAFVCSLALVWTLGRMNIMQELFGFPVALSEHLGLVLGMAGIALATGLLAGLYPAWYMTSFPTAMVLNGSYGFTARARNIKKILIGFQYVISFTLISGALFIYLQNRHIRQSDLGFDREHILESKLSLPTSLSRTELYRQRLMEDPNIVDVAFCQDKFVHDEVKPSIGYFFDGEYDFQYWLRVSPNFPEVMGMRMLEGRTFRQGDANNPDQASCIVSSLVADRMGCAPGDEITEGGMNVVIVGVFEDVRFESLLKPVEPLGLWVCAPENNYRSDPFSYSYIKTGNGDIEATLAHIRRVMQQIDPGYPVEVRFFDERLNELYAQTQKQGAMVTGFCVVAVLISLMGIFGLVVFETRRKRKEIAIRKALGSGTGDILLMFNREYLIIAAISFLISIPFTWSGVSLWLENFSEKTPLHFGVFMVSLLLLSLLTILTVTFQSWRPAQENPIKAIKSE